MHSPYLDFTKVGSTCFLFSH